MLPIKLSAIRAAVEAMHPLSKARFDWEMGQARAPYQMYADNPVGFSTDVLGSILTPGQIEVLESVKNHRVTVVQSGNSVGKTFVGGDGAHWFFHCLPGAKVITCAAPPLENLARLLWGEIGTRAVKNPDVMAGVNRVRSLHYEYDAEWWLDGIAIPSSGTVETREAKFSGKHAPYLLFIIDEADAVPPEVFKGIESCMTGGFARLVCFFNPRYQGGSIQKLIDEGAHVITLDAFSHPNVITGTEVVPGGTVDRAITVERTDKWTRAALDDEVYDKNDPMWFEVPDFLDDASVTLSDGTETTPLVGNAWRKVKAEYPEYSYMVLARFPGQALNQMIPRALIKRAQDLWILRRDLKGDAPPEGVRPTGGLDVADFGPDASCLALRYGMWLAPFLKMNGMDPTIIARWAAELFHNAGGDVCMVDTIGVGSGVDTSMRMWWDDDREHPAECGLEHRAASMRVSWSATDDRFHRMRDQMYWAVREWLELPGAMLPPSPALMAQAVAVQYWYNPSGKICVTDKKTLKKHLRQSPDEFESLALSLSEGDNEVPLGWG